MWRVKLWAVAVMVTSVAYGAAPQAASVSLVATAVIVFELLMLERSVKRYAREGAASGRPD